MVASGSRDPEHGMKEAHAALFRLAWARLCHGRRRAEHAQRLARRLAGLARWDRLTRRAPIVARLGVVAGEMGDVAGLEQDGRVGWAPASAPCRSPTAPSPRRPRGSRARRRNTSRTGPQRSSARGLVEPWRARSSDRPAPRPPGPGRAGLRRAARPRGRCRQAPCRARTPPFPAGRRRSTYCRPRPTAARPSGSLSGVARAASSKARAARLLVRRLSAPRAHGRRAPRA